MSKPYMLPPHTTPSCKKSLSKFVSMLSKFIPFIIPGQSIQCSNAPNKSVTCVTVKSKRVNSDVNVIRKNTVNVVSDSVLHLSVSVLRHLQTISFQSVTVILLNVLNE